MCRGRAADLSNVRSAAEVNAFGVQGLMRVPLQQH